MHCWPRILSQSTIQDEPQVAGLVQGADMAEIGTGQRLARIII